MEGAGKYDGMDYFEIGANLGMLMMSWSTPWILRWAWALPVLARAGECRGQ